MFYRLVFNIGVSATASLVLLVLLLVTIFVGGLKRATDKYLTVLISSYLSSTVFYFILYVYRFYGDPYNLTAIKTLYGFIIAFMFFSGYFTFEYCFHYFRGNNVKLKKTLRSVMQPYIAIVGIMGFIGLIFGWLVSYDGTKLIVYTPFIAFYVAYALISLLSLLICFYKTKKTRFESISFSFLTIGIPIVLFMEYLFTDTGIYCIALIVFFLAHFLLSYVEKGKRINAQEKELHDQQTRLMISQIQPHFIYNCLSSISYLCKVDGEKASEAINDFSNYLRLNFSSINEDKLIPFEKELEYVDAYLTLEKLRFAERVNVVYDFKVKGFLLPSLSIQPLVENAVKHGITKKISGGTVTIKTYEEGKDIVIEVTDDGVGMDLSKKSEDDRIHLGITNTRNRIENMCGGKLEFNSVPNQGATVKIYIPQNSRGRD